MKKITDYFLLLIGFGLLVYGGVLVWQRNVPVPAVSAWESDMAPEDSKEPTRITIPSIGIDLPIILSEIKGNVWDTTSLGVSYLISSPLPGEKGNSIMYGHNWKSLLGGLSGIKPGELITVHFGKSKSISYKVHFVSTVTPDETHVFGDVGDHRLTLYTCTGFLDSKRLVVTAIMEK